MKGKTATGVERALLKLGNRGQLPTVALGIDRTQIYRLERRGLIIRQRNGRRLVWMLAEGGPPSPAAEETAK